MPRGKRNLNCLFTNALKNHALGQDVPEWEIISGWEKNSSHNLIWCF